MIKKVRSIPIGAKPNTSCEISNALVKFADTPATAPAVTNAPTIIGKEIASHLFFYNFL